ncbi:hypothetical protein K1719_025528 [Acacia pycnantha]|nr:hypothetical protein K1719_025528 [Acacia pycnantha]
MGNALNILLWDWTSYFLDFSACVLYSMQDACSSITGVFWYFCFIGFVLLHSLGYRSWLSFSGIFNFE